MFGCAVVMMCTPRQISEYASERRFCPSSTEAACIQTWNLSTERRAVNGASFVLDMDVILSRRQRPIDDNNVAVFLLLLDDVSLSRTVNLHVCVLCTSNQRTSCLQKPYKLGGPWVSANFLTRKREQNPAIPFLSSPFFSLPFPPFLPLHPLWSSSTILPSHSRFLNPAGGRAL